MQNGKHLVIALITLLGCGGAPTAPAGTELPASRGVTVLGVARRVAMLDVRLARGETFDAPPARCQDVLVLVSEGEARLAPEGDQEAVLGARDAIRLGPTRPIEVRGAAEATRLFVAVTRPADAPLSEAGALDGVYAPPSSCGRGEAQRFERSSPGEVGPFDHADGRLRVSIFLDGRATDGALSSLSLLEGTADVAVPRHAHEISDEVLFIESGEGTMIRGDERVPVRGPAFVWVPAGTPHAFERSGEAPLVAYQVYAPAGPEQRFRRPAP